MNEKSLILQAFEARKRAYCPYSGFAVGAALLTEGNEVFQGCNIENAAYGPSNCAERTAIFKAVSEGMTSFKAIAIVGGKKELQENEIDYCSPCGVCRQVLTEFCEEDFVIILAKSSIEYKAYQLKELMPLRFEAATQLSDNSG